MPWQPLDAIGAPAEPAGAAGCWLDVADDLIATDAATQVEMESAPSVPLAFPSNWPAVFKESATLKALLNKKMLKGVRCRVIGLSSSPMVAARAAASAANVELHPLHSFSNARRLSEAPGYATSKDSSCSAPATSAAVARYRSASLVERHVRRKLD